MNDENQEVIAEFLIESHENLSRLDQELVELEKNPDDGTLLGSVFRTIHTIKGTCGFLAFSTLERITHHAETLLSQLRDGRRQLDPTLTSLILETVDATRKVLKSIEAGEGEGSDPFDRLTDRLRAAAQTTDAPVAEVPAPVIPVFEVLSAKASATEEPVSQSVASEHAPDAPEDHASGTVVRADPARAASVTDANIRVGVVLLDKLMDLVGELVLTRNQILQFNAEREDAALNATSQRLNLITSELQAGVMKTRMQPIGMVWNKLPRVVRDMALVLGKQITLHMEGEETELDRTIIEAIKDPIVHLVRNSCDHGIEAPSKRTGAGKQAEGTLSLRAYHEGGQVIIEISDDGAGIDVARVKQKAIEKGFLRAEEAEKLSDRESLNLIFHAGLSTAQKITNLSGRGVGMDVVKSHIEKIGGVIDILNRPGAGSTVKIKIPLTLAIIPGLVVTSGGELFVIPQVSLLELLRIERDSTDKHIEQVHGTPVYRRRGSLLPIAYLNRVLELESKETDDAISIVVLQAEDRQFGLVVDGINDTQEIVVKPVGKQLKSMNTYAGATIMGDGRVALILDVLGIGMRSGVLAESREPARTQGDQKSSQAIVERQLLLLFRAGSFERLAIPLSLVARLEEFPHSSIERAGGRQVVQYRNRILPLVSLQSVLEAGTPEGDTADPLQVVVFDDGDRSVGVVVDQILDVVEEAVTMRQKTSRKGLLGSAVVGRLVADFLDLNAVIRSAANDWFQGGGQATNEKSVLIAEVSPFSRGLIRSGLDMAGYRVLEASNAGDAIRMLEQHPVHVVVSALDLPPTGCSGLVAAMRQRPDWDGIPVMGLADSVEQVRAQHSGLRDCQLNFDREAMLESVARLAKAIEHAEVPMACAGDIYAGDRR